MERRQPNPMNTSEAFKREMYKPPAKEASVSDTKEMDGEKFELSLNEQEATSQLLAMIKERRQSKRDEMRASKRAERGEETPDESTIDGLRTGIAMQNERTKQMYERLDNLGGAYEIDPRDREDGQSAETKARIEMLKANIKDNAQDRSQEIENSANVKTSWQQNEILKKPTYKESAETEKIKAPEVQRSVLEDERVQDFSLERDIQGFSDVMESYGRIQSDENVRRVDIFNFLRKLGVDSSELSTIDKDDTAGFARQLNVLDGQVRSKLSDRKRGLTRRIERSRRKLLRAETAPETNHPTLEQVETTFNDLDANRERPGVPVDVAAVYNTLKENPRYSSDIKSGKGPIWLQNLKQAQGRPLNYKFIKRSGDVLHFADEHVLLSDESDPNDENLMGVTIGIPVEYMPNAISSDQLEELSPYELQRQAA